MAEVEMKRVEDYLIIKINHPARVRDIFLILKEKIKNQSKEFVVFLNKNNNRESAYYTYDEEIDIKEINPNEYILKLSAIEKIIKPQAIEVIAFFSDRSWLNRRLSLKYD